MFVARDGVAQMLIQRGDEFQRENQLSDAVGYYGRALMVSRSNSVAAADYVLVASRMDDSRANAIDVASAFLQQYPQALNVRTARAAAYTSANQWANAAADWRIVTAYATVPKQRSQAAFFAGMTAWRSGDHGDLAHFVPIVAATNPKLAKILAQHVAARTAAPPAPGLEF